MEEPQGNIHKIEHTVVDSEGFCAQLERVLLSGETPLDDSPEKQHM